VPSNGETAENIVDIKTFIREEHERQLNNNSHGQETLNMSNNMNQSHVLAAGLSAHEASQAIGGPTILL